MVLRGGSLKNKTKKEERTNMALTVKSLAAGTIKNQATDNFVISPASPTTKSTLIKNILLTNNHTAAAVLNAVYLSRYITSATGYEEFPISPKEVTIPSKGQLVLDAEITLANSLNNATPTPASAADKINIKFTTNDATNGVSYVINGVERDI